MGGLLQREAEPCMRRLFLCSLLREGEKGKYEGTRIILRLFWMGMADGQKQRACREDTGISKAVPTWKPSVMISKILGVKYLTVYAFSTENWKRSREEVEGLMKLFRSYLKKCMKSAEKNHMRVKIIGDPTAFDRISRTRSASWKNFQKIMTNCIFRLH